MPMWEPFWYPYDPYALVFTLALLILLAKQSYGGFTVVFAVATCNRETTFFMTFYLILAAWRTLPFRTLSAWVAVQFLIWVGVKFCLGWCFQAHSGATLFQHQYWSNIRFMFDMTYEQQLGYSFELLVRLAFMPGQFAFIWILPVLGWRYLQHFLRAGLITLIIFIAMMSYVANLYESRIFLETIPWVLTPALVVLVRWLGDSLQGGDLVEHAPTGAVA